MSAPVVSEQAILLRSEDTGESDKRLALLGETRGLYWVTAKGARKSKRRFVGVLEPFTRGTFIATQYKRTEYLDSVEVLSKRDRIPRHLGRFYLASYACEVLSKLLRVGSEAPEYFHLLAVLLDDMQTSDRVSHMLWRALFEIEILSLQGLLAEPDSDLLEHPTLTIDVAAGGWIPPGHLGSGGTVLTVPTALWMQFLELREVSLEDARDQLPEESVLRPVNRILAYLMREQLQLPLKSARLLNQWQKKAMQSPPSDPKELGEKLLQSVALRVGKPEI